MKPHELADDGTFEPRRDGLVSRDPLGFPGYRASLDQVKGDYDESVAAGPARIAGHDVELVLFDFAFLGGSMGEVAGERIARALEEAAARRVPCVLRTSTGGARMQEGMYALAQMAKVVSARQALATSGMPLIACLAHPTTGGVLASIAALADLTLAEAEATIGFAGPRVAETFTGQPLSPGSHTAEAALRHGLVDDVVETEEVRSALTDALAVLADDAPEDLDLPDEASTGDAHPDAWGTVERARADRRPPAHQLLLEMADGLVVLRGDRAGEDDPAIDCALARIAGRRCAVIALDRELSPRPSGYRKARRAIEIAQRLKLPIVTLIDTRGADPSEGSEAAGIAWAIARTFDRVLRAQVPVISIVTGEGGSGGALALAVGDQVLVHEDAIFSVIGPEAAAAILWRDATRAPEAAEALRLQATNLQDLGPFAAQVLRGDLDARSLRAALSYALARSGTLPADLVAQRLQRWRFRFGD